jgi:tetratricopeptide (TPR) repeat protein
MNEPARYDFFISYSSHDQAWAEWIAWQLESNGYTVVFQKWDFLPGMDWAHKMNQVMQQAKRVVPVLSPAYLKSQFGEVEWTAYWRGDPKGDLRLVVPVRVADVAPPDLLKGRIYIDLFPLKDAALAKAELLHGIGSLDSAGARGDKPLQEPGFPPQLSSEAHAARPAEEPRYPSKLPKIWNVQARNPQFVGRRTQIEDLRAGFGEVAADGMRIQAVFGQPGVGTTQVALEYAHRYASHYDLVWWIAAETAAAIPAQFAKLAQELELSRDGVPAEPSADQQAIVDAMLGHLRLRKGGWLLVFDHATDPDSLASYLPTTGGGHVLITSRNPNWRQRVALPLRVDVFAPEEATLFLLQQPGNTDEERAKELAEELGYLPLALEQAAAYMTGSSKPMEDYLRLFRQRRDELLALGDPNDNGPRTVDATMRLVIEQLAAERQRQPAADHDEKLQPWSIVLAGSPSLNLLTWCAFMAPGKIPLDVLTRSGQSDLMPADLHRMAQDEIEVDRNIAILYRSSLIARSDGGLEVHRLVQAVIRAHLSAADRQRWAELTIRLLLEAFPSSIDDFAAPARWPRCEQLLPHIFAATTHAEAGKVAAPETGQLLMHLGSYLQHRGEFADARHLFESALRLAEQAYEPRHIRVAHVLNALGYVLRALELPADARAAHERALGIINTSEPLDNKEVGRTLNNLGRVLFDQRDFAGAGPTLDQALIVNEAAFGRDHPEVASTLNNIGRLSYTEGDFVSARTAHERALVIKEKAPAFGPDHPSVAVTLGCLGRTLLALRDPEGARRALERALQIQESVLGENHPDLEVTLDDLASVRDAMGDPTGAESARQRARNISQALLAGRRRPRRSME